MFLIFNCLTLKMVLGFAIAYSRTCSCLVRSIVALKSSIYCILMWWALEVSPIPIDTPDFLENLDPNLNISNLVE